MILALAKYTGVPLKASQYYEIMFWSDVADMNKSIHLCSFNLQNQSYLIVE